MSIKINHNIFSLIVQRNLAKSTEKTQQSYERLSSGTRLNSSADDPAGMATSEQLQYEIQGLRQNQQNVTGAISMIGTTESQMDNMTSLVQQARQLAVQAGDTTLSANDRGAIQQSLNSLIAEMDRVASTAKFNDQFLLNGQLQNTTIQIGTKADETIQVSLGDMRIATLGACANKTTDTQVSTAPLAAGALLINNVSIPASTADGVSTSQAASSAIAKAAAINSMESQTGVHATPGATSVAGVGTLQPVSIDGTARSFLINGISIAPVTVQAGDSNGALVQAINNRTAQTGVTASVDASGKLQLSAPDGRNIAVVTGGAIGDKLGLRTTPGDVNQLATAKLSLSAVRSFTINDTGAAIGLTPALQQVNPDPTTALKNLSVANPDDAAKALDSLDAALTQISDGRSTLGAIYNRLESLTDTLARRIEDLSSTDSSIKDTDFAFETAQLSQGQILQDAAIAMLTQANSTPKRALELLRG